jgi:hypothetical protein
MNAIEDTRQLFDARLETLKAKIDGKLALIFQRLDAMPDRSELENVRKLIIWTAVGCGATLLSLMLGLRALNLDFLGQGFQIAQYVNERETKRLEELRSLRQLLDEETVILRSLRDELLQKPSPNRP